MYTRSLQEFDDVKNEIHFRLNHCPRYINGNVEKLVMEIDLCANHYRLKHAEHISQFAFMGNFGNDLALLDYCMKTYREDYEEDVLNSLLYNFIGQTSGAMPATTEEQAVNDSVRKLFDLYVPV